MILKGSRYEKVGVYQAIDSSGAAFTALNIRFVPSTPAGFRHTLSDGERLDTLAYTYYRNPEKFWRIADANTAMDPQDLIEPGLQIFIPPDIT